MSAFFFLRVDARRSCFVSTHVCATVRVYVYLREGDGAASQNGRVMDREMHLFCNMQLESSYHHRLHQAPDRGGRRTKREQLQESMS